METAIESPAQTSPPRYETTDLALAAFLLTRGFALVGLVRGEREEVAFCFADGDRAVGEVLAFHSGAVVPAVEFSDRIRGLKFLVKRGGVAVRSSG